MAVSPAFQSGVEGVRTALGNAQQAADKIVKATTSDAVSNQGVTTDIAEAVTDLKVSELQAEASAKVIKAADSALGSIIDTLA